MGSNDNTRRINRKALLLVGVVLLILFIFWRLASSIWDEEEKQLRSNLRESLEQTFPEQFAELRQRYGLHPFAGADADTQASLGDVVLVHGLDEPGVIWQELAPMLSRSHYRVWIMSYPNDQPVHESARFLAAELLKLRGERHVGKVAVVCHSMGGLVTRDMLSASDIDYAALCGKELTPSLSHFIMVGTPNHGSYFAKLRVFTEIRDQIVNAADGEYDWLQPFVDGAGEAAIDLTPDSVFLRELNARPLPDVPHLLVIAGILTPVDQQRVTASIHRLSARLPANATEILGKLLPVADAVARDIGDGLVSVQSASLPGVPLREVTGCHLTIIRNLGSDESRIPPAIPIILETLAMQ